MHKTARGPLDMTLQNLLRDEATGAWLWGHSEGSEAAIGVTVNRSRPVIPAMLLDRMV